MSPEEINPTIWREPLRQVRHKVVDTCVVVITCLGLPSLIMAVWHFGWIGMTILEFVVYLALVATALNRDRLGSQFKAFLVLAAGTLIGGGILLAQGLNTRSGFYFLTVSVFAGLVLSPRVGYFFAVSTTALTVAYGLGWLPQASSDYASFSTYWPGWAIPLLFLSVLLVTAVARVHSALMETIRALAQQAQSLELSERSLKKEMEIRRKAERDLELLNAQLEDRVTQSHQELRVFSQAIEQGPVSVMITDPKGKIEYVNSSFLNVTGYRRDEVIGENPRILQSGRTDPAVYRKMWRTILGHMTWHGEFVNRRKSGEEYIEEAWITPIMGNDGKIVKFVGVKKDITKEKQMEKALRELTTTDPHTGAANRRRFDQFLKSEISHAARSGSPISLVMLDIDFFKSFNDRFGHQAGDECLRVVAGTLTGVARRSGDLVARFGGEEFALVLGCTDNQAARAIAEEARLRVAGLELQFDRRAANITISAGVSTMMPKPATKPSELISRADAALYRAKRDGRNRVEGELGSFNPNPQTPVLYAF